ncbi:MAG: hypothetical protein HY696_02000 [Deltaproteobacteria bacterium]|nr:hypothetical protein [Deltaproteobacteria bacterium]
MALAQHEIRVQHFSSGTEARRWCQQQRLDQTVFLCDYELIGEPNYGLDLIQELGVQACAILVTSHYEEPHVQQRCAALGVRLIPKGLAGLVPIEVAVPLAAPDPAPAPTPQSNAGSSIDVQHGLLPAGHAAGDAAGVAPPPPPADPCPTVGRRAPPAEAGTTPATAPSNGSATGPGVLVIDDDTGIQFA